MLLVWEPMGICESERYELSLLSGGEVTWPQEKPAIGWKPAWEPLVVDQDTCGPGDELESRIPI